MSTTNQRKFLNHNPVQRRLIGQFHQKFLKVLATIQPTGILEVGCGEGYLMKEMRDRWPDVPLLGVDNNAEAMAEGKRLFPDFTFSYGDIYQLPQADRTWDVVIASEVLEHLEQPVRALEELRRVAQRYVLLSVPHEPWFRLGNLARGRNIRQLGNHPEHVNLWSRKTFVKFVAQRLNVQTVKSAFPWTIVLAKP